MRVGEVWFFVEKFFILELIVLFILGSICRRIFVVIRMVVFSGFGVILRILSCGGRSVVFSCVVSWG